MNTAAKAIYTDTLKQLLIKQLANIENLKMEQITNLAQQYACAFRLSQVELEGVISYVKSRLVQMQ